MSTLLLCLAGPMQSWGTQSRFTHRDTGYEPSKSGVIGLLCAAQGRERTQPVDDLAELKLGVRVDQEGVVQRDYQTAGGTHRQDRPYGVIKADGGKGETVLSERFYLADGNFLVGLEGPTEQLLLLEEALRRPTWPLFLGRKAFVPGVPVALPDGGLRPEQDLLTALLAEPWTRPGSWPPYRQTPTELRLVLETAPGAGPQVRHDQPVGAAFQDRRFLPRYVETRFEPLGPVIPIREE